VVINGKASVADVQDLVGASFQQCLDPYQRRIPKPFTVFSGKLLPGSVAVPDIFCDLTFHDRPLCGNIPLTSPEIHKTSKTATTIVSFIAIFVPLKNPMIPPFNQAPCNKLGFLPPK